MIRFLRMFIAFFRSTPADLPPHKPVRHFGPEHLPECTPSNCDISGDDWLVQKMAMQFVQIVQATVARGEICVLYEVKSMFGNDLTVDRTKIWPSMRQQIFRDAVMKLYPDGRFSPPDDLDEWTFVAYPASRQRHVGDAQSRGPLGLD